MSRFIFAQEVRYPSGPTPLILDLASVESAFVPREHPDYTLVRTKAGRYHTLPMPLAEFWGKIGGISVVPPKE